MASAVAALPAMAAATTTAIFSPSLPSLLGSHLTCGHRAATTTTVAFSSRSFRDVNPSHKRSRGKAAPAPATDEGFGVLEAELWRLRRRVELRLHRLAAEADEAYRDLRYAARDVGGDRVVLTFRRSSLRFAAGALLWSLAFAVAARALLGMVLRAWWRRGSGRGWWGGRGGGGAVVRRRDRSLGGKEVVVAVSSSPVAAAPTSRVQEPARVVRRDPEAKVPDWWPEVGLTVMEPGPETEKWVRLANRLVRGEIVLHFAIIDNRITGRDYRYDDAIQLRQLCKISGRKVSFDTENACDSFYRAAVNFVLDDCGRAAQDVGAAQVNGENPRDFLAGLATNIGLDKSRAATLAEMEMVAAGLEKNLQVAERVHLLTLYRSACTTGNIKTAAEALGLSLPDE
ncbi:hypothetical protein BAE44_0017793 [Dichanthelium oligosanthes]|uniref:Uncharacterized protein n=1 Tax=Dichanthelium oligosanthes TaxID=888268 RepID=A0A1E5V7U3_9POAL|nr:hypothetical protein BAE44_0017793 [Dichanthelium oligosanthes]